MLFYQLLSHSWRQCSGLPLKYGNCPDIGLARNLQPDMLQSLAFKNLLMTKLHLFLRHVLYADVITVMRGIHIGSLSHDLWRFMISNTFCLFVLLPWWRDSNQYWMRTISFHKSLLRFFFITCLLNPAFS